MTTRRYTNYLLELVDDGMINKDCLIRDLLVWMSESDVSEFVRTSEYGVLLDEDDPNSVASKEHY